MNTTLESAIRLIGLLPQEEQTSLAQSILDEAQKRIVILELQAREARGEFSDLGEVEADLDQLLSAHGI